MKTQKNTKNAKKIKSDWIDRGRYWEHTAKQGSQKWLESRVGRNTTTTSGGLAGKSPFKTIEQTGKIIAGVEKEVFSDDSLKHMARGTENEPKMRKWVENTLKCKVIERGLCVLKSDIRLGASIDGEIVGEDILIEIKCPANMYRGLNDYTNSISHGWRPPSGYYEHILPTHYWQMMQACFILGKSACIYVVYCVTTEQVFKQKVFFDIDIWNAHYAIISTNYEKYVTPYLKEGYPINPSDEK